MVIGETVPPRSNVNYKQSKEFYRQKKESQERRVLITVLEIRVSFSLELCVLLALAGAGGEENESEIQRMETICNTTVTELLLTGQREGVSE